MRIVVATLRSYFQVGRYVPTYKNIFSCIVTYYQVGLHLSTYLWGVEKIECVKSEVVKNFP